MQKPAGLKADVRPEIQGLRAVAVMLVVLFHLWPNRLPGGYIGVDVFFVISGFLITSHLLRDAAANGRVSLRQFWARRARRLLPASLLVLAVSAIAVLAVVPRIYWQQFMREIGAAALYVENWALAADAVDYLAAANDPSPAQHYWTLSAEEQFYLIWPFLIILGLYVGRLWRRLDRPGRRRASADPTRPAIGVILAVFTAGSLAYSLYLTAANPAASYFVTPTRAWEFGAGALLAFVPATFPRGEHARAALSWIALATIAGCALVLDKNTPMPGTAAIVVILGSLGVLLAGHSTARWSPTRILALKPSQLTGDISYSMYLWHWPLIVILPYAQDRPLDLPTKLAILVSTFVLAWLTKVFVEDPVRTGTKFGLQKPAVTFVCAAVTSALVVSLCSFTWVTVERDAERAQKVARALAEDMPPCFGAASMDPSRKDCPNPDLADKIVPAPDAVSDDYAAYPRCDKLSKAPTLKPCTFGDTSNKSLPHIALVGDSHALALMPALVRLVERKLITLDTYIMGACSWSKGMPDIADKARARRCVAYKKKLEPLLVKKAKDYDFIMTAARAKNHTGSRAERVQVFADGWRPVADAGGRVLAVSDNPEPGRPPVADCLSRVGPKRASECDLDRDKVYNTFNPLERAAKATPGASYLDLAPWYCKRDTCPAVVGGVSVYRDPDHISVTYAKTIAPYLYKEFVRMNLFKRR